MKTAKCFIKAQNSQHRKLLVDNRYLFAALIIGDRNER